MWHSISCFFFVVVVYVLYFLFLSLSLSLSCFAEVALSCYFWCQCWLFRKCGFVCSGWNGFISSMPGQVSLKLASVKTTATQSRIAHNDQLCIHCVIINVVWQINNRMLKNVLWRSCSCQPSPNRRGWATKCSERSPWAIDRRKERERGRLTYTEPSSMTCGSIDSPARPCIAMN